MLGGCAALREAVAARKAGGDEAPDFRGRPRAAELVRGCASAVDITAGLYTCLHVYWCTIQDVVRCLLGLGGGDHYHALVAVQLREPALKVSRLIV